MLFLTQSAAVYGIDALIVDIEVNLRPASGDGDQTPGVTIVGLPDTAVRESRERIRAAIANSNYFFPLDKATVNLAPADVRKEGASFDLPIALGILGANGDLTNGQGLERTMSVGELSLDGRVRPVRGALSIALAARENGVVNLLVPEENATEAAVVKGVNVFPVRDLRSAAELVIDLDAGRLTKIRPLVLDISELRERENHYNVDFSEVRGQQTAKRALEVASAGGHNILFIGPPGSGKTMLAKRLPTILPPLEFEEALEITKIHSVAGLTGKSGLVTDRPFKSPHHTVSQAGLIGGGSIPKPGEVSLAHLGVLFLDELPEFDRSVLEVLRQPLEDKMVTISRAATSMTFPADFTMVASMNPCPCGYFGSTRECKCSGPMIQRYVGKISGPLMDRIDIHIDVPAVKFDELRGRGVPQGESSAVVRERVIEARKIQLTRFEGKSFSNSAMSPKQIRTFCALDTECENLLEKAMQRQGLSARAHDRILKVSRTIADLEGSSNIQPTHISEAINYRSLDRNYWT
ncbi:MAG TPA: YifB family Mg chelatase-like AAA ATPase [Pyrinomonadaceae bacterium]|nr:YifB family Mg chelatase-like AAA ATPase [Chloracidobacterium sp.]MBP9935645.1 YifB family Mg chelatase-like AAA ATPase [Pyrinomonadaceae bacterium]MBK9437129.1 YifB family Mg chelatase-like AAA ATPase [Chloracidobacterium sp.]MBL0239801.1 YifB family Mg chelatase-like AAA ATPase [Chloracidobacterium sp.]HQX55729.1 YifB family Mg chelatase-like AAA ATPase [Pyrinomonadaceae bacterium]